MAPSDSITLRAKAKRLNIPNYRQLSLDELRTAVEEADGNATPSDNGAEAKPSKRKGTASKRKGVAKATTDAKSAPAKSKKRKSAKRKKAAVSEGTAKRQTTGKRKPKATKVTKPKATRKRVTALAKPRAQRKGVKRTTSTQKRTNRTRQTKATFDPDAGRHMIDASQIDWTADSPVGASGGNRGTIVKLLRQKKGNVQKVYDALADKAKAMYPKTDDGRTRNKSEAQTLLRWHIGRTRFDFVKSTDQHPEADNPNYRKAARKRAKDGGTSVRQTRRTKGRAANQPTRKRKGTGSRKAAVKGRKAFTVKRKATGREKRAQGRRQATTKARATTRRNTTAVGRKRKRGK